MKYSIVLLALAATMSRAQVEDPGISSITTAYEAETKRLSEAYETALGQAKTNALQRLSVLRAQRRNVYNEAGVKSVEAAMAQLMGLTPPSGGSSGSPLSAPLAGTAQKGKRPLRTREEFLADARKALESEKYELVEKMHFDKFKYSMAQAGSYCDIEFSTTAPLMAIQKCDLMARVRFLCRNGSKDLVVLEGSAPWKPNLKNGVVSFLTGILAENVRQNNDGSPEPQNAHVTIYFQNVPIYEALWQTKGKYSQSSLDGQTFWWEDEVDAP